MSLLTIVQDASLLVGIDSPDAVMASTDETVKQMRALAQQEGDELARAHFWRRLKVATSITGDGSTTTHALPSDFDQQQPGDLLWLDDSPHLPLQGPISDQEFLALKTAAAAPSRPVWRYFGANIETYPAINNGDVARYEYRTTEWISNAAGNDAYTRWTVDTDVALIPERIITLGLVWRWKRAKGLDYAEEFQSYQMERMQAIRSDGGFRTLRLNEGYRLDINDSRKNLYRVTG